MGSETTRERQAQRGAGAKLGAGQPRPRTRTSTAQDGAREAQEIGDGPAYAGFGAHRPGRREADDLQRRRAGGGIAWRRRGRAQQGPGRRRPQGARQTDDPGRQSRAGRGPRRASRRGEHPGGLDGVGGGGAGADAGRGRGLPFRVAPGLPAQQVARGDDARGLLRGLLLAAAVLAPPPDDRRGRLARAAGRVDRGPGRRALSHEPRVRRRGEQVRRGLRAEHRGMGGA